jgi:hypothetical protein
MEEKRKRGRPVGSTAKRMTIAEIEDFIKKSVKKILSDHLSWKDYIRWCQSNGIGESMANKYWRESWVSIREKYELDKSKMVSKHLAKYWAIHDQSLSTGDFTNARQTLNDIAKLMGLNEPDKMDVNQSSVIKFKFGDEDEA